MKCEKCAKEREKGTLFKFHYGHSHTERTGGDALAKEYTTTAIIVGSDQAWICKWCVSKRVLLTLGLGSFLFLGLILKMEDVNVDYYSVSYRISAFLGNLFGPVAGMQISRVVKAVWNTIMSPTFLTIWAVAGIGGAFLLWTGLKEIGVAGENVAIRSSMSRLDGYSLFLNSRHYKKFLKRSSSS